MFDRVHLFIMPMALRQAKEVKFYNLNPKTRHFCPTYFVCAPELSMVRPVIA
jgi:hypothetical protein